MSHIKGAVYINSELKSHHRMLIAVAIIMTIFLPVVMATAFSTGLNETTNIKKEEITSKQLKPDSLLDANEPAQEKSIIQVTSIIPATPVKVNLTIDLSQVISSHEGNDKSFGISIIELSGKNRTGNYNGDQIFVSASTYKLFTAYSVLLRIEDGSWNWSDVDIANGNNLAACFNDMIVFSDNDCAEVISYRVGYQIVTDEAKAMGCLDTTLIAPDGYAKTTANDLALFLTKLYKGRILTQQSSRDILINAMKNNVYREGIPTGVSGDIVADKVGFIDGYLNDAAIVYDAKGDYVLAIMTNNSSWAEIASIASEINLLRQQ